MENRHPILAIVGMCGAGKSSIAQALEHSGYLGVYFGEQTLKTLKKQKLPLNPDNEKRIREEAREKQGMAAFAIMAEEEIRQKWQQSGKVYLDGLYSWSEYVYLQETFEQKIILLAVLSHKQVRYQRLAKREDRGLTARQARERDLSEMSKLEKSDPIAYADYYLLNNGSKEDLSAQWSRLRKQNPEVFA